MDEVFWRWATWCDDHKQEKKEQAEKDAIELKEKEAKEEAEQMVSRSHHNPHLVLT